jgi:hypothetical protein
MKQRLTLMAFKNLMEGCLTEDNRVIWTSLGMMAAMRSGAPILEMTWDAWDESPERITCRKLTDGSLASPLMMALVWLNAYLDDTRHVKPWLWIYGKQYGVGKTHIATILTALWAATTDRECRMQSWGRWIESRKESFNKKTVSADSEIMPLVESPFLVLDDVTGSSSFASTYALGQLEILFDCRTTPTVITANYAPEAYMKLLRQNKPSYGKQAYFDLWGKLNDRLGQGKGGRLHAVVNVSSPSGSYRQEAK